MRESSLTDSFSKTARHPGLDGIRGIAILIVVLRHAAGQLVERLPPAIEWHFYVFANGNLGVTIFFVLSGYLITLVLAREADSPLEVILKNFYFKRVLRIFPAFFFYLVVILALALLSKIQLNMNAWFAAFFFVMNYFHGRPDSHLVGHTWSLAVEEQFYIIWPLFFYWVTRKLDQRFKILIFLLACAPLVRALQRVATSIFDLNWIHWDLNSMFHTRYDSLLIGCVLALLIDNVKFQNWMRKYFSRDWIYLFLVPCILLLPEVPLSQLKIKNFMFEDFFVLPIQNLLIACCIWRAYNYFGKILDFIFCFGPLRYLGKISFSVYLWHLLFLNIEHFSIFFKLVFVILAGFFSYQFIERPFLKLKEKYFGSGPHCTVKSR